MCSRASLLKKTIFREVSSGFVLELPTYRMPSFKGTVLNMWQKAKDFITRAGTIILLMSVVIWVLQNFTPTLAVAQDAGTSILGVIGTLIAPIFAPLGFGAWQESVALLTGLAAKEAVVSTMSVLYGVGGGAELTGLLGSVFTPLSGLLLPRVHAAVYAVHVRVCDHQARDGRLALGVRRCSVPDRAGVSRRTGHLSGGQPDFVSRSTGPRRWRGPVLGKNAG